MYSPVAPDACATHAAAEQAFADAAILPNVKAKHEAAATKWTQLAQQAVRTRDRRPS